MIEIGTNLMNVIEGVTVMIALLIAILIIRKT